MRKLFFSLLAVYFIVRWEMPSSPNLDYIPGSTMPERITWEVHDRKFSTIDAATDWMKHRFWTQDRERLHVRIIRVEEKEIPEETPQK